MNLLYAFGGIDRFCLRKVQYRSKSNAQAACRFKEYRCPHCRAWHITHAERTQE